MVFIYVCMYIGIAAYLYIYLTNPEDKSEGKSVWIEVSDPPPIMKKTLCAGTS